MSNKTKGHGRTIWDFISEHKKFSLVIFSVVIIFIVFFAVNGFDIKLGGFELKEKEKTSIPENIDSNNIDASNALIVTENQSGGTNTVINQKFDTPKSTILLKDWSVKNEKLTQIYDRKLNIRDTLNLPTEDAPYEYLYFNQFQIIYSARVTVTDLVFLLKREDVIFQHVGKSGMIRWGTGATKEGYKYIAISQPENGVYTFGYYSKNPIEDIKSVLEIKY